MFRDLRWYQQLNIPLTAAGVVPGWRYVVRKKGVVEAGTASCHSRVMPDGSLLNGAQGNFPTERDFDLPPEGSTSHNQNSPVLTRPRK